MDEWFTPTEQGAPVATAAAPAQDDGIGFVPIDNSREQKSAALRAELKQVQKDGPDYPWYAPEFMLGYDPKKPLVNIKAENVKPALYGPLTPTVWLADKMGLIPSTAKLVKKGAEESVAAGVSSFTAPETAPLIPAAAIPFVGPAMGLYFGTKAAAEGAGQVVAGAEQGDPEMIGSGLGNMVVGGTLLAGGAMGAKQAIEPTPIKLRVAPETSKVEVSATESLKQLVELPKEEAVAAKTVEAVAEPAKPVEAVAEQAKPEQPPVIEQPKLEQAAEAVAQPEKTPVPEGMERSKFIDRFKNLKEVPLEAKKAVEFEFYDKKSPREANELVNADIELNGLDSFIRRLKEKDNGLTEQEQVVGSVNVMKRLIKQADELRSKGKEAEANYVTDRYLEITEDVSVNLREYGRGVQAARALTAMTPEGIFGMYKRIVNKTVERGIRKNGIEKDLNKISDFVRSEEFKNATPEVKKKMLHDAFKNAGSAARHLQKNTITLLDAASKPEVFDVQLIKSVAEALKLPRIDEAFAKDLIRKATEASKRPEGFQRDAAMSGLLADIRKQIGIPMKEVANSWWYASILSGPMTQAVNAFAGAIKANTDLAGLASMNPKAAPIMAANWGRGFVEGILEAAAIIGKGDYSRKEGNIYAPATLEMVSKSSNPVLRAASVGKHVGRMMAAADMVNFKMAERSFASLEAFQQATREGLSGAERTARVKEILKITAEDTKNMMEQAKSEDLSPLDTQRRFYELREQATDPKLTSEARDFGLEATLNQTPVGHIGFAVDWITQLTINEPLARAVVPFARIVGNAFNEQLNWTPLGELRGQKGFGGPRPSKITNQNAKNLHRLKAVAGTVAMIGLYKAIQANQDKYGNAWFDVTAGGPDTVDAKNALRETGWKPYSMKMGDKWVSWQYAPFAIPLALVGYLRDAEKYKKMDSKTALERFSFSMVYAAKSIMELSFLSGFNRFVGGLSGGPQGAKGLITTEANAVKAFVLPNLVKWLDQVYDPQLKDAKTLDKQLIRDIPVVRQLALKPAINALGETIEKEGWERIGLDRFWTTSKADPVWDLFATKKVFPSTPQRDTMLFNEPMTEEQFYDFSKRRGEIIKERLIDDLIPFNLMDMEREQFQDHMEMVQRYASKQAKVEMLDKK
jgi:hypothetical protein